MAIEADTEEIENFTLEVMGARPDGGNGVDCRTVTAKSNFQTDALFLRDGKQVIHNFKSRFGGAPVHAGHVRKIVKGTFRIVPQKGTGFPDSGTIDVDRHFLAVEAHFFDGGTIPGRETRDGW